jgi:hypothetical protein
MMDYSVLQFRLIRSKLRFHGLPQKTKPRSGLRGNVFTAFRAHRFRPVRSYFFFVAFFAFLAGAFFFAAMLVILLPSLG